MPTRIGASTATGAAMSLDLPTILAVFAAICGVGALVLALAWLRGGSGRQGAYLWWSAAFVCGGVGSGLRLAAGSVPDFVTIDIGNAFALFAFSLAWAGVASFDRQRPTLFGVLAGPLVWILLCRIPDFHASAEWRITGFALIAAAYCFAIAWAFWRRRAEAPWDRLPLAAVASFVGVMAIGRVIAAPEVATSLETGSTGGWGALVVFLPIPAVVAAIYFGLALARGRTEARLEHLAVSDPLTGILNRRALVERGRRIVDRAREAGTAVSVLLFDLDHFKSINDRYGHQVGDAVIRRFAEIVGATLRPSDLLGRMGGEEFAVILPDAGIDAGQVVAERVREAIAAQAFIGAGARFGVTVSGGVAASDLHEGGCERLISVADAALYEAKHAGRDRTVAAAPDRPWQPRVAFNAVPPAA
jgi:diguanylate cyclase (GGDEF)-like protein